MKKVVSLLMVPVVALFIYTGCEKDGNTGTLNLSITDAPIDDSNVAGIWLTINEIQYHMNDQEWYTFEGFDGPKEFNLLELTNGVSELLGSFEMEAGTYTQLRFMLDAPEMGNTPHNNPGCYIEFDDGSTEQLFVPSGHESGWKGVGAFQIPSNGTVDITADFDARKSVIETGMGNYILKPTIRLVVDNQAGKISGGITNIPDGKDIVVYAYEDDTYTTEEADDPTTDTIPRFPNAISSAIADDSDSYHLVYLAPMTYDLIVTTSIDGEFGEVLGTIEDVLVESKKTTNLPIDISEL
ncbi:MAG TPA: DUF4382 domain-containing protein [Bacteroidales bacterium]|nr:DUF4382 domain-containing protein [Bacteroidales bacterium]